MNGNEGDETEESQDEPQYLQGHTWQTLHWAPPLQLPSIFSRASSTNDVCAWLLGVMKNVQLEWRKAYQMYLPDRTSQILRFAAFLLFYIIIDFIYIYIYICICGGYWQWKNIPAVTFYFPLSLFMAVSTTCCPKKKKIK